MILICLENNIIIRKNSSITNLIIADFILWKKKYNIIDIQALIIYIDVFMKKYYL